jgi:hypothetical protein
VPGAQAGALHDRRGRPANARLVHAALAFFQQKLTVRRSDQSSSFQAPPRIFMNAGTNAGTLAFAAPTCARVNWR